VENKEGPPPEIVIIRRGGRSHDEGHHGGAWKIAYADFMTAMMALFLVMWLISASDEKTVSQVASYFNPVPLTDRTTAEKGVQDRQQGGTGKDEDKQPLRSPAMEGNTGPKNAFGKRTPMDEGLFADPFDVLTKLASKAAKASLPSGDGEAEAFRDPFDPEFRYDAKVDDAKSRAGKQSGADTAMQSQGDTQLGAPSAAKQQIEARKAAMAKATEQAKIEKDGGIPKEVAADAKAIEAELRKALAEAALAKTPGITVEQTPEGVLISVTDQLNFEMFGVSSALPKPELVVVMEKLGKALAAQSGRVVVRGHTDGRPFRSKVYDNWRLSTSRAQIAYYMLVRGGLDEQRVERIEGHADRELKIAGDPNAAANRRIEILLRPAKT